MPVLLQIPENPNCEAVDGQIFQCQSPPRVVTHVLWEHDAGTEWCPITGIEDGGAACPATACIVEDSGEGACYLVAGGGWGLRLRPADEPGDWDLENPRQWGVSYLLLAGDGSDLRFAGQTGLHSTTK
jgi:hypothetical protein